ncbi:hypothetical protein FSP39_013404, partial [Pinctada imbricata]
FCFRPFFTYFISFVQTVIMICALAVYGFSPLGVDEISEQELIVKPSLVIELEKRSEFGNFWLGPSQQNLIHLGAKYSPCMRKDPNLEAVLKLDRDEERMTGCCVRDDGSGCVQTIQRKCSGLLSTFVRWNDTSNIRGGYKSGAVCGTDPRYCKKPASTKPFEWDKNDFTNWPICEDTNKPGTLQSDCSSSDCHMTCDLLGRPCCHGIQGECMITTREHCDFKKGYFHDDKFLCSQVNCFEEICGMIPFVDDDRPDQFSRVLSANLLHAGVFHLAVSLLFQLIIMRMAEKEIGWVRMALIYLGSGTVGTLASSVLLPYQVEVCTQKIGWVRMALICLGSGTVGTRASSVLLPYQVEVNVCIKKEIGLVRLALMYLGSDTEDTLASSVLLPYQVEVNVCIKKEIGLVRLALMYLGSDTEDTLASSVLLPYQVEVNVCIKKEIGLVRLALMYLGSDTEDTLASSVLLPYQVEVNVCIKKEIGLVRLALMYLGSDTEDTLASSVLLPYQVEVGPSGAQFGVLACMYVDILNVIINRKVNNDHADNSRLWNVFILYSVILLILFVLGLLPWLDNWAHIFGFISGVFISLVVMKDVSVEGKGLTRWVVVLVSLIIFLLIFILLLICFYVVPVTEGSWIQYINCIPITETFCKNMDVAISRGATYTKYT